MRRAMIAAVLCGLAFFLPSTPAARAAAPAVADELAGYLSDVPSATRWHYGLRDNLGNEMSALKVAAHSQSGYVGTYHTLGGTQNNVKIGVSSNLIGWGYVRDLASNAWAPTIRRLSGDGSYIVAYQTSEGCSGTGGASGSCLRILRYANAGTLLTGSPSNSFTAPRTLSNCEEGTPSIASASTNAQGKLVLTVAFHYFADCVVHRQAKGTLVDFSSWSTGVDTGMNALFASATPSVGGHVRDRDMRIFRGVPFNIHEAQLALNDGTTWGPWLHDPRTNVLSKLNVRTHLGSRSFGYPTITNIENADGSKKLVVTYYVYPEGAAAGEAGELIFYHDYETTIAAAGDISSASISGQQRTSDLIVANPPSWVLTLGDNQYETGTLTNFIRYYGATWGRFKSITYPSPGNHDRCPTSGYDEYFNKPCWYSFDLGKWHLISLDSNRPSDAQQLAFLEQDLAANTKQCVLAFWHHPRFSSGEHGNHASQGTFWTRLYNANADLVVVGHDHTYERFAPQSPSAVLDNARGIREFVVGTGGKSLYAFTTIRNNSEVRYNGGDGVLRLTLRAWGYDWRFESVAGQTFTDTGSGDCH